MAEGRLPRTMARHAGLRRQHIGVTSLALLGVLLLIVALVVGGWSAGLLTVRSANLAMRLPHEHVLPMPPNPNPNPSPMPLPKPGPGVTQH